MSVSTHLQSTVSRPPARDRRAVHPTRATGARTPEALAAQIEAWHRYETPEQLLTLCDTMHACLRAFGVVWQGRSGAPAPFEVAGLAFTLDVAPERVRRAIYEMQLHGMVTIEWDGATAAGVAYDRRTPGWAETELPGVYVGVGR